MSDAAGLKLAQTAADKKQMVIAPDFSKWGIDTAIFTISGNVLKEMAESTQADLILKTTYGVNLTIPNAALAELAHAGKEIAATINKDGTITIQADGIEINTIDSLEITIE